MSLRAFLVSSAAGCHRAALVVLLTLLPSGLLAQQQPTFRSGIDLIEVDVTVVNRRGEPMEDLRAAEFKVTVDGQPRNVVTAEFVDLRTAAPERQPVSADAGGGAYSSNAGAVGGRVIVLMVDRGNITFGSGSNVTGAVGRFLDKLTSNDRVALITLPHPGPQVDFTANHDVVRDAVDGVVGLRTELLGMLNIGIYEAFSLVNAGRSSLASVALLERFCGQLPPADQDVCADRVLNESELIVTEQLRLTGESLETLELILDALREIDGPKHLVWLSEGLIIDGPGAILRPIARTAAASRTTFHALVVDPPVVDASVGELPPTPIDDRTMREGGLRQLASMTRGDVRRVGPNPGAVFERLETEISGHYVLGVESLPSDRGGEAHDIDVSVLRQGARVRARREFVVPRTETEPSVGIDEQVLRVLSAPFVIPGLPLRLATYVFQAADTGRVRVFVSAEIDAFESSPAEVALGFSLRDLDGNMVANAQQQATLTPVDRPHGAVLERVVEFIVDPGSYVLKLAVVDEHGRRGSVEHRVQAWQLADLPFAAGDLLLADASLPSPNGLVPPVEAQLVGNQLAVYTELYSDQPATLDDVRVRVEITELASEESRVTGTGSIGPGARPQSRVVSSVVPIDPLPPGRYVARAIVTRDDERLAQLSRSFQITRPLVPGARRASPAAADAGTPAAASPDVVRGLLGEALAFQHDTLLTAEVIGFFMDRVDADRPALRNVTSAVRAGDLTGAGLRAFETGDQMAAAFLQGLNLFAQREWVQARTQFSAALSLEPDFAPAAFYLGACYAAGGHDTEAVTQWRRALLAADTVSVEHGALADALFRTSASGQAILLLREALTAWPKDDELLRRLAIAHALELEYDEALAIIEPYVERHPTDPEALLVALVAMFSGHADGSARLDDEAVERMRAYANAYGTAEGPHLGLALDWVRFVSGQ